MHHVTLTDQLEDGMAEFFIASEKHYRRYQKVYKFQLKQQKLYFQHFYEYQKHDSKRLRKDLRIFMDTYSNLTAGLSHEQERIGKCQVYLSYYEHKSMRQSTNYLRPQPRLRYPPLKTISVDNQSDKSNNLSDNKSTGNSLRMGSTHSNWFTPPPRTPSLSTIETNVTTNNNEFDGVTNRRLNVSKTSTSTNRSSTPSRTILLAPESKLKHF